MCFLDNLEDRDALDLTFCEFLEIKNAMFLDMLGLFLVSWCL